MFKILKILFFVFLFIFILSPAVLIAQDNNNDDNNNDNDNDNNEDNFDEDELFPDEDNIDEEEDPDNDETTPLIDRYDILDIGGSLFILLPISVGQATEDDESPFSNTGLLGTPLGTSLYFDARVNETIRGLFELDLSYTPRYYDNLLTHDWIPATFDIVLDELFLDINANYIMFFRFGKQNIRWGSGYSWSPTDFINSERKDPLEPDTDRNGITGIKFTLPIGTFNFISFLGLESLESILDISVTLRTEFAYKFFEISTTAYYKKDKRPMFGADFTFGADFHGTWDFWGEASLSPGSNRLFVAFDESIPFPSTKYYTYKADNDEIFVKAVAGLSYTNTNIVEWLAESVLIMVEYYYNGEGYDNSELYLLPYTLLLETFEPFEMGKHYINASLSLSEPFTIADFRFLISSIMNLSDYSSITYISASFSGIEDLSMSLYVKVTIGNEGTEFYFASVITAATFVENIINTNNINPITQEITGYDNVLREILSFGFRLSIDF